MNPQFCFLTMREQQQQQQHAPSTRPTTEVSAARIGCEERRSDRRGGLVCGMEAAMWRPTSPTTPIATVMTTTTTTTTALMVRDEAFLTQEE